ncbi:helix-turn-helix transcriptional regulator [Listeria welshimeri]|uniref:helix-turn-helix domain-containing protein n=1 Tax=Listeria welshimeri TaxID=1643 RepID=UPI0010DB37D7|nr:helix-turn-helix transcriptional regulator [Listeria welshimeri]EAE7099222.1 XRE family transcriptional regulator [Listeria monocytogenes]EAE9328129.1 XRE family transcriptional regulator [Listeria monocytogenes]EAF6713187.1 XRE family transcriptional regulator [Listeria monocytogenes]EAG2563376.1 XRE family transcriptional regulator [Listeria monocytogenes]EFP0884196.1 helix-turn-helix transcriptional regulator [Listeria monocytogenes]
MISERLKHARKIRKLTQDDLAKLVNTSKATISNYENKYSSPSADMIVLLADALNVTTDYLLGKSDVMYSEQINKLVEDKELNSWLYDLIENKPADLKKLKELMNFMQNMSDNDK